MMQQPVLKATTRREQTEVTHERRVVNAIQAALRATLYPALACLEVIVHEGLVMPIGTVPSYHQKSLVIETCKTVSKNLCSGRLEFCLSKLEVSG